MKVTKVVNPKDYHDALRGLPQFKHIGYCTLNDRFGHYGCAIKIGVTFLGHRGLDVDDVDEVARDLQTAARAARGFKYNGWCIGEDV